MGGGWTLSTHFDQYSPPDFYTRVCMQIQLRLSLATV